MDQIIKNILMLRNQIKVSLRKYMRNKAIFLINFMGLIIGLTVFILIINYASFEFSYDTFHKNGSRIYRVESRFFEGDVLTDDWATSSYGYGGAMKEHIPGIEEIVRVDLYNAEQVVRYGDVRYRESRIAGTEPSFFKVFDFELTKGDQADALARPNTVVLSESAARRYFKHEDPIGKILEFKTPAHTAKLEVTGLFKDMPEHSHIQFDMLYSWISLPEWRRNFWYSHEIYTYVLLNKNISPVNIETAFPAMAEKYKTHDALKNKVWGIHLQPIDEIHLTSQKQYEREVKGSRLSLYALIGIALIILIIAWINYINIITAQALTRQQEISIRKVNGAGKSQVFWHLLSETLFFNLMACVVASLVVVILMPAFNNFVGKSVGFFLPYNTQFFTGSVILFLAGIILSGIYPAYLLVKTNPVDTLKGKGSSTTRSGNNLQKTLVVIQFAASFIIICGTITSYLQYRYMLSQPAGVNIDNMVVLKYPVQSSNLGEKVKSFKEEIRNDPVFVDASVSNAIPGMEVATFLSNHRADDDTKQNRLYEMLAVDKSYLSTYGLEVAEGRGFSEDFGAEVDKLVINEESVKMLGYASNEEAIGKKVNIEGDSEPMQIIGVIKNYHQQSLVKTYTPIMLMMKERKTWIPIRYISVRLGSGNTREQMKLLNQYWQRFFPESTFDSFFLSQFYQKQYNQDKRFNTLFNLFSLLSVLLASLGLLALSLFATLARRKEIGVRKVNGATTFSIVFLLNSTFLKWVLLSILLAMPLALMGLNTWLANYAYHIPVYWWIFVVAGLLSLIIASITVSWQSYLAAVKNPVESLRYE